MKKKTERTKTVHNKWEEGKSGWPRDGQRAVTEKKQEKEQIWEPAKSMNKLTKSLQINQNEMVALSLCI